MPEIIEVKKYVDFINKIVKNKDLLNINIINGRYHKHKPFENYNKFKKLLPIKLLQVESKGKLIYFTFENNIFLLNTLGLSGGWAFFSKTFKFPDYVDQDTVKSYMKNNLKHINVEFIFKSGKLVFFDTLSFGTIKIIMDLKLLEKKLNIIGPDIMHQETTFQIFKDRIKLPKNLDKPIGLVLVDQKVISGVGNYLRADTLWLAKISPFRKVKKITDIELKKLYQSIRIITWIEYDKKYAIKNKIIKKTAKSPSYYERDFYIYNEETDIYGNSIVKDELFEGSQKRFIYWCPSRQK